ncbi:MAG TPA: AraC family transcriptional regulator [Longimicrobiales bacterium]|nr:AraC family transcriptional regulator [Longimicrobiales bacterium]
MTRQPQEATLHADTRLSLLRFPYTHLEAFAPDRRWPSEPGALIVWKLERADAQTSELRFVMDRPASVPLAVVLPPAEEIERVVPLIEELPALRPRIVLPTHRLATADRLRYLLAQMPPNMPRALLEHLRHRSLLPTPRVREEVGRILELSPTTRSISALSRRMYTSRRTLGRVFSSAGLPAPSHWLQFGRLMHVVVQIQNSGDTAIHRIALRAAYPDGFTMSNQMKRLLGVRPSDVRVWLGWEWVVESWIRGELERGGIDRERYRLN